MADVPIFEIPQIVWLVVSETGYPIAVGPSIDEAKMHARRRKNMAWSELEANGYTCRRVRIVEIPDGQ